MERERETHEHESFGQIRFSRVSGGGTRFYGSELTQDHYINMEVCRSEKQSHLSNEWYFNKESLIQVRLSSLQFAEMLTSMNYGSGIPCTIESVCGKKMEDVPEMENRKISKERQFNKRTEEFLNEMKLRQEKIEELLKKPKLSKADKEELSWFMTKTNQELSSNMPFFKKTFVEEMEKVVVEAKSEIESAITHKINKLGVKSLNDFLKIEG